MFQTKDQEKIKHLLFSVGFPENRAVYETVRKNTFVPDMLQMKI
jgi:hypothetical protein